MAQALAQSGLTPEPVNETFRRWLNSATALVSPLRQPANPFMAYSGLAANAIGRVEPRLAIAQPRSRQAPPQKTGFMAGLDWVREAYLRLESLISGDVQPKSPAEARKVFTEAQVTVERRTMAGGKSTNYLRDNLTGASAPSARVSPKLNDVKIDRMLGRDSKADKALANERVAASGIRDAFTRAGYTRELADGTMPFTDWKNLQFAVAGIFTPSHNPHGLALAYGVVSPAGTADPQGYIGLQVDVCEHSPEDTWAALRSKATEFGLRLPDAPGSQLSDQAKAQLSRIFAFHPEMHVGTPILLRDGNLVPSAKVNPSLRFAVLETGLRVQADSRVLDAQQKLATAVTSEERQSATRSLEQATKAAVDTGFRAAMASSAGKAPKPSAKVLDIASIRAARVRRATTEAMKMAEPVVGFDTPMAKGAELSFDPSAVIIRYENGHPQLYVERQKGDDPALFRGRSERPLIEVSKVSELPPGRYRVENEFQMPDGEMMVMPGARTRRLGGVDLEAGFAPSMDPSPRSDDDKREFGATMSR